jgi:3,4-dihydroxy-2-butanone 4-phosphate synthase
MATHATTDSAWDSTRSGLDGIDTIVAAIRAGEMVVILDDEERENEGDLVMAASRVRAEDVNFMAKFGRGLICLTLTRERCEQLRLPLMVSNTDFKRTTNFTVSIEAAEGVTTGISAHDRAQTILAAVAPGAQPSDLRQPGHIFPLMAQPGGVLTRAGHTEAGCDLARLAGLEPAAVIVEILNDDKGLGHEGSRGSVVPALALVDVAQDLEPFGRLDAALEHAGCAALDELVVDDAVGGGPALHLPGLDFVVGEFAVHQKGEDWL